MASDGSELSALPIRSRCVSMEVPGEATVNIQIIDLGKQYYVWVSAAGPTLSNLHIAIQSHMDTQPAVAALLPAPASSQSASLAKRIGMFKADDGGSVHRNTPMHVPIVISMHVQALLYHA